MDVFVFLSIVLMVIAVIGSFTPVLPGALLSVSGILIYWWSTGFTSPGPFFLAGFILAGMTAFLLDYFAGTVSAKASGASTRTSLAAGLAGLIFLLVLGPVGILIGVALTVFIREYLRTGDREGSLRAAVYSTAGILASAVFQVLITVSLLVAFLVALAV